MWFDKIAYVHSRTRVLFQHQKYNYILHGTAYIYKKSDVYLDSYLKSYLD